MNPAQNRNNKSVAIKITVIIAYIENNTSSTKFLGESFYQFEVLSAL